MLTANVSIGTTRRDSCGSGGDGCYKQAKFKPDFNYENTAAKMQKAIIAKTV